MNRPKKLRCFKCWREGIPSTWLVICGALLVQVGFGLYPVIVKLFAAEQKANPIIFSFYRDACCFPLLFLCAFVAERKIPIPSLRMLILFMVLGLLGMFGNQLLYILGVYWAGPVIASAFQPIIPVWTAILAVLTCVEKIPSPLHLHTWVKMIGILVAAGGAIELTLTGVGNSSNTTTNCNGSNSGSECPPITVKILGYVALFGNTICMSVYVLVQKRFIFNSPGSKWKQYPVAVTAYSYFFGAVFMGLSTIYFVATGQGSGFRIPLDSWYALVYAVFITSALCYLLITWSNLHLSSTIATSFWPFQVLVAVVAAYFITGDKLENAQYGGAVMLIVALMLVLFGNHMDERLSEGRDVIHLDCCCPERRRKRLEERKDEDEKSDSSSSPLLGSHSGHRYSGEDEDVLVKKSILN